MTTKRTIKLLAMLLVLSMLLSSMTFVVLADDTTNDDENEGSEYIDDTYIMKDTGGSNTSITSSSNKQWNKANMKVNNVEQRKIYGLKDPLDSTNSIAFLGYNYVSGTYGTYKKNYGLSLGQDLVFSGELMIPDNTKTEKADKHYIIAMDGVNVLDLTLSTAGIYTMTLDGTVVGTLDAGTWLHFSFRMRPTSEDGKSVELTALVQGDGIKNTSGVATQTIKNTPVAKTISKTEVLVTLYFPDDAQTDNKYGILFDNVWFYTLGDFYNNQATLPKYSGELYDNVQLDGALTVSFQRPVDASTLGTVKVVDSNGTEYPYNSISFDPSHPYNMTIDFSGHALPTYTQFAVVFGDELKDTTGNAPLSTQIEFETKGVKDALPKKLQQVTVTSDFVMPDEYNTGYRGTLVPIADKYPELVANNYVITEAIAQQYNYEFSGFSMSTGAYLINRATTPVSVHDFYYEAKGLYGIYNQSAATFDVSYFEGVGSKSAFVVGSNLHVSYAYIHDCAADILKAGGNNIIIEHSYFRDAGTRNPGSHADGIQLSGSGSKAVDNIQIVGNRFDMPFMYYDHLANACIFIKPEKNTKGYSNLQVVGNWLNGGGYTVYISAGYITADLMPYLIFTDNKIGNGYNHGTWLTTTGYTFTNGVPNLADYGGEYSNNGLETTLDVGSIVLYDGSNRVYSIEGITSGSAKVLLNFANYTLGQRTYKVSYNITNADGEIIYSSNKTGSIRAYQKPETYAANNTEQVSVQDKDGNTVTVTQLKYLPNLPANVGVEVNLTNLPTDLTGCKLNVVVEDTTSNSTWIRSTVIDTAVHENTITELPKEEPKYYTVTFVANEETISTQSILKGEGATEPNNLPEVEGYRFKEWDTSFTNITSDTTVTAVYEVIPQYTVTFVDCEGTLETITVNEGSGLETPEAREKAGYYFTGWDNDCIFITEDLTVNAIYEEITEFLVVFYDADGATVLKSEIVQKNESATPPVYENRVGYRFIEWDKPYTNVTSVLIIKAVLEAIPQYTVTFIDASGTVDTKTIYEGDGVVAPTPTTKEGYTFKSWDHTLDNITSDTTITAEYEMDKELFTSAIEQLENAQTLFSKKMAIRGVNTVLSYWTEEEIQTLDETQMTIYTSAVSAYNLVITNAQSDLTTVKEILSNK